MPIRGYIDDDSGSRQLHAQLRADGHDVIRSDDVGLRGAADEDHLRFAAQDGRVLVTANASDFIRLHWEWLVRGENHAGIIIASQAIPFGERIRRLRELAAIADPPDFVNRLELLSHWR